MAIPEPTEPTDERTTAARRHARRVTTAIVGGGTVAVGIVLLPLPGPGSLVIIAGLSILGREFPGARRAADRGRKMASSAVDSARRGIGGWFRTETDEKPPEE